MQLNEKIKTLLINLHLLFQEQPLIFVASVFSVIYGAVTVIIGGIKLSYFIGITGACALIFGIAKLYAIKKYAAVKSLDIAIDIEKQVAKNIAISASVMSFLHFCIAIVCTFFEEESPSNYGLWFIYFFAGMTFIKIAISLVNVIRTRKNHNIIIHNIKLIDNANALIALGLIQRAIIYYVGNEVARWASGLGGILFSLCALLVCLVMFIKNKHSIIQKNEKINHLIK